MSVAASSDLPPRLEPEAMAPAPGAKTGRICGILAIVLALTCVGIPVAIILGIVALVKTSKAKSLARNYPETYDHPSSAGLVLGIVGLCLPLVMLPFAGIVSAIAIPAVLSQRARARDNALLFQWAQVRTRATAIALESSVSGGRPLTGDEAIERLVQDPSFAGLKNSQHPGEAVLIRGTEPRPGTIALSPGMEETAEGTTWSIVMKASFGPPHAPSLREEKIELGTTPRAPDSSLVAAPAPGS
jgi:hypothetical protein